MGATATYLRRSTARGSTLLASITGNVGIKGAGRQVTAVVLIVNSALDQICRKSGTSENLDYELDAGGG